MEEIAGVWCVLLIHIHNNADKVLAVVLDFTRDITSSMLYLQRLATTASSVFHYELFYVFPSERFHWGATDLLPNQKVQFIIGFP